MQNMRDRHCRYVANFMLPLSIGAPNPGSIHIVIKLRLIGWVILDLLESGEAQTANP